MRISICLIILSMDSQSMLSNSFSFCNVIHVPTEKTINLQTLKRFDISQQSCPATRIKAGNCHYIRSGSFHKNKKLNVNIAPFFFKIPRLSLSFHFQSYFLGFQLCFGHHLKFSLNNSVVHTLSKNEKF